MTIALKTEYHVQRQTAFQTEYSASIYLMHTLAAKSLWKKKRVLRKKGKVTAAEMLMDVFFKVL